MKEEIKKILANTIDGYWGNNSENIERGASEIESLISSNYLSKDKVMEMLLQERKRGMSICSQLMVKHKTAFKEKWAAGNQIAFVQEELADLARTIGNTISGLNALSALSESIESEIKKEYGL